MASSILRLISRKPTANSPLIYISLMRGSMINVGRNPTAQRTMSNVRFVSTFNSSPWLMLPPDNNNKVNKFYSVLENKVFNLNNSFSINSFMGDETDEIEFISSSHGWLTLFNPRNCDLFLFNPISGHHIKLPPIHTLPIPKVNLRGGYGCVDKLITSCSPENEECRVVMSFGPEQRLAFCSPGCKKWTPIGALYHEMDDNGICARCYESFIYSNRHKRFYCFTQWHDFEAWDLRETQSPKCIPMPFFADEDNYPRAIRPEEDIEVKKLNDALKFLVVDEESGDLFVVVRNTMYHMAPDGSFVDFDSDDDICDVSQEYACEKHPYKTIGFDVYKYDQETRELRHMDRSFDGLSFFIGKNHSFAGKLKPNSIYFTDVEVITPPKRLRELYGGHDIGIFNYEDRTFSPCYYPVDRESIRRIIPAPMWFTPSLT